MGALAAHPAGLARRAIAVELRRKGVADEVAQEALAEVDTDAEEQRARELVDRKLRTVPADTPERRTTAARRLVGMLARRGYPAASPIGSSARRSPPTAPRRTSSAKPDALSVDGTLPAPTMRCPIARTVRPSAVPP